MINFNEVIQNLIEVNKQLSDGSISIEKAKQVSQNTQVIINGAKVILDFARFSGNKEQKFLSIETEHKEDIIIPERKPFDER